MGLFFFSSPGLLDAPVAGAFNGLDRFSGFGALSGLCFSERGAAREGTALGANESTIFFDVSSLSSGCGTSVGGEAEDEDEEDGPASAAARSICSAISSRSRCSSEVVARSFLIDASYISQKKIRMGSE
jgi:hypothetical protein